MVPEQALGMGRSLPRFPAVAGLVAGASLPGRKDQFCDFQLL